MAKKCYICSYCLYKDQMEVLYLENKTVANIYREFMLKDPQLTYNIVRYHLKNHLKTRQDRMEEYNANIENELKTTLDSVRSLKNNLEIVNNRIENKLKGSLTPEDEALLLRFLGESRQIISELKAYYKDLNYAPSDIDLLEARIYYSIGLLPLESKKAFLDRWNSSRELSLDQLRSRMREEGYGVVYLQ